MESVDPAFGHWLAGFIDGEGSFSIARIQNRTRTDGRPGSVFYSPRFSIRLRCDDRPILEEIVARTGWGSVYDLTLRASQGKNARPQAEWVIHAKADLIDFCALLEWFPLRAKKRQAFEVFASAVAWWARQPKAQRGLDWAPMVEFRERLHEAHAYRDPLTGEIIFNPLPRRPRSYEAKFEHRLRRLYHDDACNSEA